MLKDQGKEFILSAAGMMCDVKIFPCSLSLVPQVMFECRCFVLQSNMSLSVCTHNVVLMKLCCFYYALWCFSTTENHKASMSQGQEEESLAHFSMLYIWFTHTHALSVHVKCIVDWNWNTATSSILPPPPCTVLNNASAHPGEPYWCLT